MKIGITGGGIAGLTAAYRLQKAGHSVELFEKDTQLGGLARSFDFAGAKLDIFYRHIFTSDLPVIDLIEELGLKQDLLWLESKMGFYHKGVMYPFSTPMDILFRFKALSFIDRVRVGLMSVYLTRVNKWEKYEKITCKEWVEKYVGGRVYEVVWGPLLEQKFGDMADKIAMTWLYGRIHSRIASRSGGGLKEYLGYLKGSYQKMIDTLEAAVVKAGGVIHKGDGVNKVIMENGKAAGLSTQSGAHKFDAVILTCAPAIVSKIADFGSAEYNANITKLRYVGAMALVMRMKKSLSPVYWLNVAEKDSPFVCVVEQTNYVPKEWYGGDSVVYIGKYLPTDSELYKMENEGVKNTFFKYLKKIFPEFNESDVLEWKINREPFSQPVVEKEYSKIKPDYKTPVPGLYMANMAMIYPEDRGMAYSVRLGNEVAAVINTAK
ncbi:MAG: NAD(P)/FAD-dependent oxidoreductase [Spirochaetia bacterium]|nr:NAD(P)/FAD-dependent oxidoreductase [Spirochaetia bacterium]